MPISSREGDYGGFQTSTFSKCGLEKPNHEKLIGSFTTDIRILTLPSRSVVSSISEINNKKVAIKLGLDYH